MKKNEPLAELWIPQWAAAQQEYLAVRRLGDSGLTAAARDRLRLQLCRKRLSVALSAVVNRKPA
ncbi:Cobalt/zinc/cadmium efflux RND transporter [Klebsiella michiganensis]|nr:Cobalt/zinc/cadmium efflux RND transporter [Klebsiella michiganensis]